MLLAASSSAAAHSPVSRAEVPWKGARTDFGSPVGHEIAWNEKGKFTPTQFMQTERHFTPCVILLNM